MKRSLLVFCIFPIWFLAGCAPAIIGAGAAGVYTVATDERTTGTMLDDSSISATIKSELIRDGLVEGSKIDVDTIDGNVILSGVVDSELQSTRAVEIANQYEGVKSVRNNLQIGSKTFGQAIDDKMIGSKIKAKLIGEKGVPSMSIDVDVNRGIVTLSGIVDSQTIKNTIIDIARTTTGTKDVVDNIKVKPGVAAPAAE